MLRTPLFLGLGLIGGLIIGCGEKEVDDSGATDDSSVTDDSGSTDDSGTATEDCGNGADDDGDGATDCDDTDCADDEACQAAAEDCAQPGDEDADGLADCSDDDCAADAACECVDGSAGNATGAEISSGDVSALTDNFSGECGSDGGEDVAYAWTAPADGCYSIDTDGSNYDTVLRLYPACGAPEATCNDDSDDFGLQSQINTGARGGSQWLIVVDAYSSQNDDTGVDTGAPGSYVLNINSIDPSFTFTADADLGDATGASVATGTFDENSTGEGQTDCGSGPSPTMVYSWTAPTSGRYTFDTYGSSFDTILGLFDGNGCGEVACDDDGDDEVNNESEFSASVMQGATYYIELSGYGGDTGDYILNINPAE